MNAAQDWKKGSISLFGKTSKRWLFDMGKKNPLDEDWEKDEDSSNEDSSTILEVDS